MAQYRMNQRAIAAAAAWVACYGIIVMIDLASGERPLMTIEPENLNEKDTRQGFMVRLVHFFWQSGRSAYDHIWPVSFFLSFVHLLYQFSSLKYIFHSTK